MSLQEQLPGWASRRIPSLKRNGILSFVRESIVDLSVLNHLQMKPYLKFVKTLDLSGTPVTSLSGLPNMPHVLCVKLDQTKLENLKGISAITGATSISLTKTPFEKMPHYKLSILISIPTLVKIDDKVVTDVLKKRAGMYPSYTAKLINNGWIATYPPPSREEFAKLREEYNVEIAEEEEDEEDVGVIEEEEEINEDPWDFEKIVLRLCHEHELLIQKKLALFGIVEEFESYDDDIGERIASLFNLHGIEVDGTDDHSVLSAVNALCKRHNSILGPVSDTFQDEQ